MVDSRNSLNRWYRWFKCIQRETTPREKNQGPRLFAKKNYSTTSDLLITNVKILSLEILKKNVQYILINIFCSLVCSTNKHSLWVNKNLAKLNFLLNESKWNMKKLNGPRIIRLQAYQSCCFVFLLKPVTPFIVRYYVKDASINNLTLTSYNDGINSIATWLIRV